MPQFRNASLDDSSRWKQFLFLFVAKQLSRTKFSRLMTKNLGQSAEFAQWQVDRFSNKPPLRLQREKIWKDMLNKLSQNNHPIVVWEFGVAWGYTTHWWLSRIKTKNLVWRGFDRFTGLPRAWRHYHAGAFDAAGVPPDINDDRVRWYVGDVENTLPTIDIVRAPDVQWIILFDLDIYEPTKFAWDYLSNHLRAGDLIYFDEAIDPDERRLLDEDIINNANIKASLLARSPIALALTVEETKQVPSCLS